MSMSFRHEINLMTCLRSASNLYKRRLAAVDVSRQFLVEHFGSFALSLSIKFNALTGSGYRCEIIANDGWSPHQSAMRKPRSLEDRKRAIEVLESRFPSWRLGYLRAIRRVPYEVKFIFCPRIFQRFSLLADVIIGNIDDQNCNALEFNCWIFKDSQKDET